MRDSQLKGNALKTSQVLLKSPTDAVAGIATLAAKDPALVLVFGALPYFEVPDDFCRTFDRFLATAPAAGLAEQTDLHSI